MKIPMGTALPYENKYMPLEKCSLFVWNIKHNFKTKIFFVLIKTKKKKGKTENTSQMFKNDILVIFFCFKNMH